MQWGKGCQQPDLQDCGQVVGEWDLASILPTFFFFHRLFIEATRHACSFLPPTQCGERAQTGPILTHSISLVANIWHAASFVVVLLIPLDVALGLHGSSLSEQAFVDLQPVYEIPGGHAFHALTFLCSALCSL